MKTLALSSRNNLDYYWKVKEENLRDSGLKLDLLKGFKTKDNLVVINYPSGLPFKTLGKVCSCVNQTDLKKDRLSFVDLKHLKYGIGHNKIMHLVRSRSEIHEKYEHYQRVHGGLNAIMIEDLGEIRIAEIGDSNMMIDAADFSLYILDSDIYID